MADLWARHWALNKRKLQHKLTNPKATNLPTVREGAQMWSNVEQFGTLSLGILGSSDISNSIAGERSYLSSPVREKQGRLHFTRNSSIVLSWKPYKLLNNYNWNTIRTWSSICFLSSSSVIRRISSGWKTYLITRRRLLRIYKILWLFILWKSCHTLKGNSIIFFPSTEVAIIDRCISKKYNYTRSSTLYI
jgi:hypothetical protein